MSWARVNILIARRRDALEEERKYYDSRKKGEISAC